MNSEVNYKKSQDTVNDIDTNTGIEANYPNEIKETIVNLKKGIDKLGKEFDTIKNHTLNLATQLNESKLCATHKISIRIKDILKDEIKKGKITGKWIEECLPPEYKRKYDRKKSEVSSLLEKEKVEDNKIMITADGNSVNEDIDNDRVDSGSPIDLNNNVSNNIEIEHLSENSTNEDGCYLCKPIQKKNRELEQAFKSISLQTVNKFNKVEFKIPKERQIEINEEFNKCNENIIVQCYGLNKITSIKADIKFSL